MDNENGTAAVVTTKVDEHKPIENVTSKTDAIDTTIVETVKSADANLDGKLAEAAVKTDELKAINNTANDVAVSKTTTTVTVNVTQTKVVVDEVDKSRSVGEVVSTVSSIAEAAVNAVEKAEQKELNKSEPIESSSVDDVEMIEPDTDCEMKDVSLTEEQPQVVTTTTTTIGISETKTTEADTVNSTTPANENALGNNEAEQKIDDVEKNISNLFNGDDNVGSTNDKSNDDLSKTDHSIPAASSQSDNDLLKNGTDGSTNESQSSDAIKDNNDLVSILAGSDKPEDNISSSINAPETQKSSGGSSSGSSSSINTADAKSSAGTTIENKLLKGITSTPSNTSSQTNVFNSTPIQKQFEISSENVSTISEPAIESEQGIGGKATKQELISSHSSTIHDKSSDLSTTVTGSESSSDNLANFAKAVEKINGLSDETDVSIDKQDSSPKLDKVAPKGGSATVDSSIKTTPQTPAAKVTPEPSVFDINICYDDSELVYFSVERQDANKTGSTTDKSSISGSVTSVTEPFALPRGSSTLTSNSSTLSSSSSEVAVPPAQHEKTRQEVKGTVALCDFIINHFEQLRSKLAGTKSTPVTGGRRGRSTIEPTTPSTTGAGSKRKRGAATQESPALNDTDSEAQPKSAKKVKKEPATPKTPATTESDYPEKPVLARWVDKKFYAGRVIDQKPNNKYVVLFEDGAKKTLPEEHIVFGKDNILPLVNESVHALVSDETYEPGIVESVETKDDGIYYKVVCETITVTVTASNIYLEEDQAKVIIAKHTTNNPEPGFSGGLSTRKDRRNKRYS